MLTLAKIRTYEWFKGDIDGFARTRGRGDHSGITDEDWSVIDQLRQSLFLVASGLASTEFATEVEQRLQSVTDDEQTREALRRLSKS